MVTQYGVQTAGDYDEVLQVARWAERRGLVSFALPDHYLPSTRGDRAAEPVQDAFAQLAGLARETSNIRLAMLVSPITFRHPAVLAKNAVTIDAMSGGRFSLGVGTGWLEAEHDLFGIPFPSRRERFDRLEEALAYLRASFSAEAPGFQGDYYQLAPQVVAPHPSSTFYLVVGGMGARRTPELAGRYADEYNVYPAPPAEMAERIARARAAADEAGRDPDRLLISSSGAVLVGHDEADYQDRLATLAASVGATVEELEEHFAPRNTPRGSADEVKEQLAEMEAIGVERFYVQALYGPEIPPIEETLTLLGA
ncbi:MAG: LLM class flavin-dependent oxidoreductase [Acidimicrobiia bacterium]|nr:LLM class flavin-dependent oxidoreductase [Acidimicrobiia bacterium]